MDFLRLLLPSYKKTIEYFSNGKGYGKNKKIKKILSFFNFIFKSSFVDVRGQKMYLIKGFEEYATVGVYGVLDTHIVESLIKPGDYAIDVGAAIGYFTLIFAKLVGKKNGLVIAFEPKAERFEILTKNVNVNNYENIKLEKKAILKDDGSSTFFSLSDGAGLHFVANSDEFINESNSFKQKIPKEVSTINLDKYLEDLDILKKISFMKIDVDGPELLVLQSSELLLQNRDLKILIEWDVSSSKRCKCNPETLIDILLKNNFKIFYPDYKRNRFFQVSKNELLTMPTNVNETINLICVKDLSILKKNSYFEI